MLVIRYSRLHSFLLFNCFLHQKMLQIIKTQEAIQKELNCQKTLTNFRLVSLLTFLIENDTKDDTIYTETILYFSINRAKESPSGN